VRHIYNLTRNAVKREELIYRTQQAIEKNIDQFFVFEIDENLIASVSLTTYPKSPSSPRSARSTCLPFYQNRGIGRKMVNYACMVAKERGATTALALSTQSSPSSSRPAASPRLTRRSCPSRASKPYEESGRNSRSW